MNQQQEEFLKLIGTNKSVNITQIKVQKMQE